MRPRNGIKYFHSAATAILLFDKNALDNCLLVSNMGYGCRVLIEALHRLARMLITTESLT